MSKTTAIYGSVPLSRTKNEIINTIESDDVFGVKFPLYDSTNSGKGLFVKTKGLELLKSELRQFIKTERGERVMLPNFGLSLRRYLFEPLTEDLVRNLKKEVIGGISAYIPKAVILSINVFSADSPDGFGVPGIKIHVVITSSTSDQRTDLTLSL